MLLFAHHQIFILQIKLEIFPVRLFCYNNIELCIHHRAAHIYKFKRKKKNNL